MSKIEQTTKNEHNVTDERWNDILKQAIIQITGGFELKKDLLSSDILFEKSVNRPGGKITLGVITRGDLQILRDEYSSKNKSANLEDSVDYLKRSLESLLKQQSSQEMTKIQSKKYITVKEFSEIYSISKTSQQNYRGRIHDPLPYHQKVEGGKISYIVEEVKNWLENQHK
jgi:hypothetical protein